MKTPVQVVFSQRGFWGVYSCPGGLWAVCISRLELRWRWPMVPVPKLFVVAP